MIHRDSMELIQSIAPTMPVLCILGPRQAGKTTLARSCFPHYAQFLCDNEETIAEINANPAAFLRTQLALAPGIIIDEFQLCPRILPAIKNYVDEAKSHGTIILSGSQNYLMMACISESLAGRVALIDLLPLSINELKQAALLPQNIDDLLFTGSYPRLYVKPIPAKTTVYEGYIRTYLERDVRILLNVPDLAQFHKFIQLCAGRIGQLLNLSSLAADAGVSVKTAQQWISLLETSYVIHLLRPHHANFNKQLTKNPKLYFHDTGLATQLLNIASAGTLSRHSLRGSLFENFVINECIKWYYAKGQRPPIYFWRDAAGNEIDLIIDHAEKLIPVEIKSADIARNNMTDGLIFWHNLTGHPITNSYVIYTGTANNNLTGPQFVPWENIPSFLSKLIV